MSCWVNCDGDVSHVGSSQPSPPEGKNDYVLCDDGGSGARGKGKVIRMEGTGKEGDEEEGLIR